MAEEIAVKVIARIHTDFPEKFGIPRQSGLIEELKSTIVFEPEFRDANALRGIEEYSHLWLIWEFSEAVRDTWSPMVRPPRLGGNKRMVSIQIQFRQHCSLQGFLICGKQKAGFRSALELLYLLEDCLREQDA